jgi:HSP20 family molecular chaperone IbpA
VEVDSSREVRRLLIHGEHRDERSDDKEGRTLREIRYGSFRRSFQLPAHVTADAITATYDAGVLTVRVTGALTDPAETQTRRIEIADQSPAGSKN